MSATPAERVMRASIAAHESWARTEDRSARTGPARKAMLDRFERQVDPDGKLTPEERATRASHARKAHRSSGVQMINMGELFKFRRIGDSEMARVPLGAEELARSLVTPGDLMFARRSLQLSGAGRCALVVDSSEPRTFESSIIRVRLDVDRACPAFYFYFFTSGHGRQVMETIVEQAVVAGIRASDLRKLIVPVPPIAEQRGIAAALGALDDKIESNRRAQAIIWDLLGAEFDLRAALSAPAIELRSLLRLDYGKSLPAPTRVPGAISVYGSNGITGTHNTPLIGGPGVIVGRKGSVGEVHWSHAPSFPIDTTYYVTPAGEYPLLACYFALLRAGLTDMNSHSAIPGLNRESALAKAVRAPGHGIARNWAESRECCLDELVHLEGESSTLSDLRDTLLPELLSGRVRVTEAREVVEEAVG